MTSSPCRQVCLIDPVSKLCSGCGRTLAEIAAWSRMTEAERLRIMRTLAERPGWPGAQVSRTG